MIEINEIDIWNVSKNWLESAMFLGLGLRIAPSLKNKWASHYHLIAMSRAQFSAELSYERFVVVSESQEITKIACGYLELHSFLVSAHFYWRTLEKLAADFPLPDLANSVKTYTKEIKGTKCARDHMEHFSERIESGRTEHWGKPPMAADIFRRSLGKYSADSVTFGSESFDLRAIYDAIRIIGRKVAPKLRMQIESGFAVKVTNKPSTTEGI